MGQSFRQPPGGSVTTTTATTTTTTIATTTTTQPPRPPPTLLGGELLLVGFHLGCVAAHHLLRLVHAHARPSNRVQILETGEYVVLYAIGMSCHESSTGGGAGGESQRESQRERERGSGRGSGGSGVIPWCFR